MVLRAEILLFHDALASEAFVVRDTLALADAVIGARCFDVAMVSVNGRTVRCGGVEIAPARATPRPDLLVVPGLMAPDSMALIALCGDRAAERSHITRAHHRGARIACICVGAFLAAAAGILDGRRVTTAWPVADALARWRPAIHVDAAAMVLRDGPILSTGAMSAAYDLALTLIEETSGADPARRVRKLLALDDGRGSQRAYASALSGAPHTDPLIQRAQGHLQATLAQSFDMAALARASGASARTLSRRFRAVTGDTPLQYRHRLVVEAVKALLETTTVPLAHIPARVGYGDEIALRRIFKLKTGLTFKAYRNRFGALPAHRA